MSNCRSNDLFGNASCVSYKKLLFSIPCNLHNFQVPQGSWLVGQQLISLNNLMSSSTTTLRSYGSVADLFLLTKNSKRLDIENLVLVTVSMARAKYTDSLLGPKNHFFPVVK